jgi:hypothetical protein
MVVFKLKERAVSDVALLSMPYSRLSQPVAQRLLVGCQNRRKCVLTLSLAKMRQNAEAAVGTYELFICINLHCFTNSFAEMF